MKKILEISKGKSLRSLEIQWKKATFLRKTRSQKCISAIMEL